MGIALVGGMDRMKKSYEKEARKAGLKLKHFTGKERGIGQRIGNVGYVVLLTDKLSHAARKEVMSHAKSSSIPVYQFHSSGLSTVRDCFHRVCKMQ
jgi:hypothetical protein